MFTLLTDNTPLLLAMATHHCSRVGVLQEHYYLFSIVPKLTYAKLKKAILLQHNWTKLGFYSMPSGHHHT